MRTKKEEYSFAKGYYQLRLRDAKEARAKLMEAIGVTTRVGFEDRRNGFVTHKFKEHYAIERIFAEYGITEVWGWKD